MSFSGKTFLIAGASRGIGLALAQHLAENGAQVLALARTAPANTHPNIRFVPADLLSQPDLSSHLPEKLDGVAYCAGSITLKPFHRLSEADFQSDYAVNVLGAVHVLQQALPALKKAAGSSVVLFSTVAVGQGMGFHASIAAAKGAVEGLGRSLAAEWAPNQIRVNVIAPSLTDTSLAAALLATPEKREASGKRHPLGRVGTAEEVAALAAHLLSEAGSWITGQVIGIDGGLSRVR